MSFGWLGYASFTAYVNDDILRADTLLHAAHLRMFAPATEEARRFDLVVSDGLPVLIPHAVAVLFANLFVFVFDSFLLLFAHGFLQFRLLFEILRHLCEITFA